MKNKSVKDKTSKNKQKSRDFITLKEDKFLNSFIEKIENIILLSGFAGAGKSTFCIRLANELIYEGYTVYFYDTEHQLVKRENLIVDKEKFIKKNPLYLEDLIVDMINIIEKNAGKEKIAFIWDSVAATPLKSELQILKSLNKGDIELSSGVGIAQLSRYLSVFLRNIQGLIYQFQIPFIITNQYRAKIQLNPYAGIPKSFYGEKGEMPGGYALKHAAYMLFEFVMKERDDFGMWVRIRSLKNKQKGVGEIEYYMSYDLGFDPILHYIKYAINKKIEIENNRGWYKFKDKQYRLDDLIKKLYEDKTLFNELKKKVDERFNIKKLSLVDEEIGEVIITEEE